MDFNESRLCPICGGDSKVYRVTNRADGIFVRTRVCKSCGAMFDTLEIFTGHIHHRRK